MEKQENSPAEMTGREILVAQNTAESLQDLAAQRHFYDCARFWFRVEFIFDVVLTAGVVLVGATWGEAAAWVAVAGVLFPLLATHVFRYMRRAKQLAAASIQERFDCRVLRLVASASVEADGPVLDEIIEAAEKYNRRNSAGPLPDWYTSGVDQAPFEVARILCQRENVQWDKALKHIAGMFCLGMVGAVGVAAIVIGLLCDLSFRQFLVFVAAPVFPLAYSTTLIGLDLRRAAHELVALRKKIDGAWHQLLRAPNDLHCVEAHARQLQDDIFRNRAETPMVPKRFYRTSRQRQEVLAGKTTEQLVDDYLLHRRGM